MGCAYVAHDFCSLVMAANRLDAVLRVTFGSQERDPLLTGWNRTGGLALGLESRNCRDILGIPLRFDEVKSNALTFGAPPTFTLAVKGAANRDQRSRNATLQPLGTTYCDQHRVVTLAEQHGPHCAVEKSCPKATPSAKTRYRAPWNLRSVPSESLRAATCAPR